MIDRSKITKLVVVGSPVLDEIKRFDGEQVSCWGGIIYSLYTFIRLVLQNHQSDLELIPVFKIGNDKLSMSLVSRLFKYNFVKLEYIIKDGSLHRNYLVYSDEENRDEYFTPGDSVLDIKAFMPLLEADAFFINYIYPDDLPLSTLMSLSYATSGWIFLDVHSLVRRIDQKSGKFYLTRSGQWQEVVPLVDIIQMNITELQAFTGLKVKTDSDIFILTKQFLSLGPKVVLITNGGKPGFLAYRTEKEVMTEKFFPDFVKPVDPTGCGDVFGAAFFYYFIKTRNPPASLERALEIARLHALRKWIPEEMLIVSPAPDSKSSPKPCTQNKTEANNTPTDHR